MTLQRIASLEHLVGGPRDGHLLRFSLGNEYLNAGDTGKAIEHLARAAEISPQHSATWHLLGKAYLAAQQPVAARAAFERGVAVAEHNGDAQALKVMRVALRRLDKAVNASDEKPSREA